MGANPMRIQRAWIKLARYGLRKEFMRIMGRPLKGYQWTTNRAYEYLLGTHESPEVIERFLSWFNPDSVFYDVGANVGYFSFLASTVITRGHVVAFEPMAANLEIFEEHIRRNRRHSGTKDITLLPFAVADCEKTVEFTNDQHFTGSNTYVDSKFLGSDVGRVTIKCHSIDDLVAAGRAVPTVIKIDVEGAEFDVLRGAAKTIRKHLPHILIATHDVHLPGVDRQCTEFLRDIGYSLTHTGAFNHRMDGLEDYIAIHPAKASASMKAA